MAPASRRTFLKTLNLAIGGVLAAILAVPGLRTLFFPVRRRIVDSPKDFLAVGMASAVGKKPMRVEIVAPAERDAWSKVENVRLGAAWLVRDGERIRAFSATCPHLGCPVDFDAAAGEFHCPCHKSAFTLSGERISGPAKRSMDPLETRIDDAGRVEVRFRRYKQDRPEREDA